MTKKIILHNKNKIAFRKKMMIIGVATGFVGISFSVSAPFISSVCNRQTFTYNGVTFNSLGEAVDYVKNNSTTSVENIGGYNSQWKITVDGKTKTFKSSGELLLDVYDQYISSMLIKSSLNLQNYSNENGELVLSNNLLSNIYDASTQAATIYQGLNDVSYNNEEQAYNSYFTTRDAYYFNGIYFENRSDLYNYLVTTYLPQSKNNKKNNVIIISGPNGINSAPIDLTSKDAYNNISEFIANNATVNLQYINSESGESFSINNSNIDETYKKVSLNDLEYVHVQSNEGESRYVVDNDSSDPANLIGPYFYDGVLDVGSFKNKKMWKKVNGVTSQVYVESKVDTMIGSFFSSIINDDSALILSEANETNQAPLLFRTLLVDANANPLDEVFLTKLNELSPRLYLALVEANMDLLKGKKYNTFYKFAILYNFLMQRIVSWNLGQDVLGLVIDYFKAVGNFIQDSIELVVVDKSLLVSADGKSTFNFVDFFNVGNPEYDLNSTCETFMNQLKTNYPKFVAAMHSYIAAQNNVLSLGGLIPYTAIDGSYLVEYGIISQQDLSSIGQQLKNIYDIFSKITVDEMIEVYSTVSSDPNIQMIKSFPKDQWLTEMDKIRSRLTGIPLGTMLSSIGAKNSNYHNLSRAALDLEIKVYLDTGLLVKHGYLTKLYSSNKNYDRLQLFLEYITNNPNEDSYRVFLAMLIDKRMNTFVLNSENTTNPYEFAKAIAHLVGLGLGTAGLAGSAIKKIHMDKSNARSGRETNFLDDWWFHEDGDDIGKLDSGFSNPLSKMINDKSKYKEVIIDSITNETSNNQKIRTISKTGDTPLPNITPDNEDLYIAKLVYLDENGNEVCRPKNQDKSKIKSYDGTHKQFTITSATARIREELRKESSVDIRARICEYTSLLDRQRLGRSPSFLPAEELAKIYDAANARREQGYADQIRNRIIQMYDGSGPRWSRTDSSNLKTTISNSDLQNTGNNTGNTGSGNIGGTGNVDNGSKPGDGSHTGNRPNSHLFPNNTHNLDRPVSVTSWDTIWDTDDEDDVANKPNGPNNGQTGGDGNGQNPTNPTPTPNPDGGGSNPGGDGSGSGGTGGSGGSGGDGSGSGGSGGDGSRPTTPNPDGNGSKPTTPNPDGGGSRPTTPNPDGDGSRPGSGSSSNNKNSKLKAIKERMSTWWSGSSSKFDTIKRAGAKIASHALEIFGGAFMAMEMFFIIYELLRVDKTQDFYVYTTADGTEFIWDGGLTTSKYFGFEVKQVHGIDEMVLVNPIQITLPQIDEYYYFNETKYFDPNEMKKAELKYFISGGILPGSNAFTAKYSLSSQNSSFKNAANSILELIDLFMEKTGLILNSDGTIDYSKLNTNSEFLLNVATSLGDGYLVGANDNYVTLANNISNKIRATKLTILPETINNVANGKLSLNDFVMPGDYWDGTNVIKQDPSKYIGKILFDNSANDLMNPISSGDYIKDSDFKQPNSLVAENQSENSLYEAFKSSFILNTKSALPNQTLNHNFSNIIPGSNTAEIFIVNANGKTKVFVDRESAINYFMTLANLTKISDDKLSTVYWFEDQCFTNEDQIVDWVRKNF